MEDIVWNILFLIWSIAATITIIVYTNAYYKQKKELNELKEDFNKYIGLTKKFINDLTEHRDIYKEIAEKLLEKEKEDKNEKTKN